MKINLTGILVAAAITASAVASAQSSQAINHRRHTENDWRKLTYGSAALGALGLISHNGTLTTIGAAGTLYSASRWQADQHSRNQMERQRAEKFSHSHFYSHGHRYTRHTKWRHGKKYYYFTRDN